VISLDLAVSKSGMISANFKKTKRQKDRKARIKSLSKSRWEKWRHRN
jgi:hypothetical protein